MRILIILTCFLIFGCRNQEGSETLSMGKHHDAQSEIEFEFEFEFEFDQEIEIAPPRTAEPPPSSDFSLENGSRIIKNGNMKFEVDKLGHIKAKIDSIVGLTNGYYVNELYNTFRNKITHSLKLRIPNTNFDSLVFLLEKGIGKLKSKNVSSRDVTEEYVDLTIRLENKVSYLKQYRTILLKAKSIKEILDVQEKIRRIEEEIESKKGRIKYLDNKVNLSTLNLEISELISIELANQHSIDLRIVNAFKNGFQGFLSFTIALINLWPFLLIALILFIGRKPIKSSFKRRGKNSSHEPVQKNND